MSTKSESVVELILTYEAPCLEVWAITDGILKGYEHIRDATFSFFHKKMPYGQIANSLKRGSHPHFHLESGSSTLSFCPIGNSDHALYEVDVVGMAAADVEKLIRDMADAGHLISARIYDREYNRWQNAEDPAGFTEQGKAVPVEKLIRDEIFNRDIVDTSGNPGRRTICQGYVAALGYDLWITNSLLRLAQAKRPTVLSAARKTGARIIASGAVIHLQWDPEFFRSDDEENAGIQNAMRKALFPCEKAVP